MNFFCDIFRKKGARMMYDTNFFIIWRPLNPMTVLFQWFDIKFTPQDYLKDNILENMIWNNILFQGVYFMGQNKLEKDEVIKNI